MKASELRIGNLVDLGNRIAKVIEIYHLGCVVVDLEETQDTIEDYERTKGIPLTEEWLLDLGFSQQGKRPMWVKGKVCVVLARYPDLKGYLTDKKFYIGFKDLGNVIFHTTIECEHVHTLQNAVALTGEELTIR
jgi:hypothetical protein